MHWTLVPIFRVTSSLTSGTSRRTRRNRSWRCRRPEACTPDRSRSFLRSRPENTQDHCTRFQHYICNDEQKWMKKKYNSSNELSVCETNKKLAKPSLTL